ncbi:MAG: hypothetical protein RXS42_08235 [Nitrososphaeria archaeon]
MPDGTGLRAEDIDGVAASLEARLGRSLTFGEQCRLLLECIEKAKDAGELRECADRLYEEFSKRLIQPSQRAPQARPARLPRGIVDARGLMIPFAGHRRRERVTGPPGESSYVVVTCRRDGKVDVFRARTADQAKETAADFNEGGKVLCYGLEDECREWIEKSESGEEVDECVQFWAGYNGP